MSTLKAIEAVIDDDGTVHLREAVHLSESRRAFVVILDAEPAVVPETALLSEAALATDWNRPEDDDAWSYLQPDP